MKTAATRTLACLFVASLALAGAGCKAQVRPQGERGIEATYSMTTLSTTLPEAARVPAVIAAAEQTVRARGYTVDASEATEDAGRLIARPPRTNDAYPRLVVTAHAAAGETRVEIKYQPLGDQDLSRSVLDGILTRLGL